MAKKTLKMNPKAWGLLTEDEKTALSLQYGLDKSTWQSGEIMAKSHYKYLEIKYRAEKFLKMFTEHFELYDDLIPDYIEGDKEVILYFRLCMEKRKKPIEAIFEVNANTNKSPTKTSFNQLLIAQLDKWAKTEDPHTFTIFHLVKEFDRWNNFRILPKEIQEPSAFKRRVKNAYRKHLKILTTLTPVAIDKIKQIFKTTRNPSFYLPLIVDNKGEVIRVKANKNVYETFTGISLYLYEKPEDAQAYVDCLMGYVFKSDKSCTDGLSFWPKYRECIKLAYNYEAIQKITPTRKHLELAFNKLQFL